MPIPLSTPQVEPDLIPCNPDRPRVEGQLRVIGLNGIENGECRLLQDILPIAKVSHDRSNESGDHRLGRSPQHDRLSSRFVHDPVPYRCVYCLLIRRRHFVTGKRKKVVRARFALASISNTERSHQGRLYCSGVTCVASRKLFDGASHG